MTFDVALITGATGGIGSAFAEALDPCTDLILTGRDTHALAELEKDLAQPGRVISTVVADLTEPQDRVRLAARADALGVDLLINNAGSGCFGPAMANDAAAEEAAVALSTTVLTALTRALVPGMIDRARIANRRAGLINVSSTLAFQPVPFMASYAAAKAYVLSYTEALAEELRRSPIDVLCLCPGATKTAFGQRAGFRLSVVPGAVAPHNVAREGLNALGRRTVHVCGIGARTATAPLLLPRAAFARGIGLAMAGFGRSLRVGRTPP